MKPGNIKITQAPSREFGSLSCKIQCRVYSLSGTNIWMSWLKAVWRRAAQALKRSCPLGNMVPWKYNLMAKVTRWCYCAHYQCACVTFANTLERCAFWEVSCGFFLGWATGDRVVCILLLSLPGPKKTTGRKPSLGWAFLHWLQIPRWALPLCHFSHHCLILKHKKPNQSKLCTEKLWKKLFF